ncbi:unnamed protein product, partial [Ectocarpus sp. 6 AP-2014]
DPGVRGVDQPVTWRRQHRTDERTDGRTDGQREGGRYSSGYMDTRYYEIGRQEPQVKVLHNYKHPPACLLAQRSRREDKERVETPENGTPTDAQVCCTGQGEERRGQS